MNGEEETIILLNEDELKDGYFTFSTSIPSHYRRLVRRVGAKNILETEVWKNPKGRDASWIVKVKASMLSKTTFGIKNVHATRGFRGRRRGAEISLGGTSKPPEIATR